MKTIIAISATANQGKTHAVLALADCLPLKNVEYFNYGGSPRPAPAPNKVLCRGEMTVNGVTKRIGLSSEGDNDFLVQGALNTLARGPLAVDVLVLACRTKGAPFTDVRDAAADLGYEMVWTAPYHGEDPQGHATPILSNHTDLNKVFAENMSNLIQQLLQ